MDVHNSDSEIKHTIAILLGFWLVFYVCRLLQTPLHAFLSSHMTVRSEYTVGEQLSKFYLFIVVLISIFSYQVSKKPRRIKLSILFLLLSLILYMAESNMITEQTQPVFGLMIVLSTGMLLLRERSWLSLTHLLMGFMAVAVGALSDLAHESEYIGSLLPTFLSQLLQILPEERFDVIGMAFVCLSAMLCFRVPLRHFVAGNTRGILSMLLASGMITVGNGFLHYEYDPSSRLHASALALTISGFVALIFANKRANKKDAVLTLGTENLFYLFILAFFVVLPSIHGNARSATALLLWLPIVSAVALYLWRYHPARHPGLMGSEMV
jgi:hypothetical protein